MTYDPRALQSYQQRHLAGGGRGHTALSLCLHFLSASQTSRVFPFYLPLVGKKLTSGPLCCHSCNRCCSQDCPGWCDQRHSRGGKDEAQGPAREAWLCPAFRVSFLPEPSLSQSDSCCLADSPGRGGPTSHPTLHHSSVKHLSSILLPASVGRWGG